ncbi:hypothetical protein F4860DRAFT_129871 [Xylaria cubensis]|nr:hypothetical protein F4860DRAFT_129871 [Xylaria cubensis]
MGSGDRSIPLQVICPAMSRSGTESMKRALEMLGVGRTMHGFRLGERPDDMDDWLDLVDRKYPRGNNSPVRPLLAAAFDRVIGDCGAVTDMPCVAFWRELMAAYPNAKVILIERDVDEWYRSFETIVVNGMMSVKGQVFANPWVAAYVGDRKIEMMFRVFLQYFQASDRRELAANAKRVYLEHNAAVRQACREQGRPFLDYKLGDGWAPLCKFLGVGLPQKGVDFPRGNEAASMEEMTHKIQRGRVWSLVMQLTQDIAVAASSLGVVLVAWKGLTVFLFPRSS